MISTHILDTSLGKPAMGVIVTLEKLTANEEWVLLKSEKTNSDGRINYECPYAVGTYRLSFEIVDYFKTQNLESFFQSIPVLFKLTDTNRKYHVPLLLSPYGYSTYRGS